MEHIFELRNSTVTPTEQGNLNGIITHHVVGVNICNEFYAYYRTHFLA